MIDVKGLPDLSWCESGKKIFQKYLQRVKNRCILQGFADRGGVSQEVEWFIKKIQPISVGV